MERMADALTVVAKRFNVPELTPDAAGYMQVQFADVLDVYIRTVDDQALEFSARIDALENRMTPQVMREMLRWNGDQPYARLSVQPDSQTVVYGERMHIIDLSADGLVSRVNRFMDGLLQFIGTGGDALLERVARHAEQQASLPEAYIRL